MLETHQLNTHVYSPHLKGLTAGYLGSAVFKNARLDLKFAVNKSLVDSATGQNLVTFTRASTGTFVGSNRLIQTAATNDPRFDHNPTTGESLGLLVEEARTNLLLNSATLSTQSVTVAAAANTLSFYGTGTVTLTGVSTAGPLVGTGANNRVSLTFTPTVGVLVLTVSGSVTNAQLEAGAFPTSYIPTTTATVTRAADVVSITGSNFSSWYNQTEGTVFVEGLGVNNTSGATRRYLEISDSTALERMLIGYSATNNTRFLLTDNSVNLVDLFNSASPGLFNTKNAAAYKLNSFQLATNGTASTEDTSGTLPTVNQLVIGVQDTTGGNANTYINGTIKRLTYWPTRLANTTLQQITQP